MMQKSNLPVGCLKTLFCIILAFFSGCAQIQTTPDSTRIYRNYSPDFTLSYPSLMEIKKSKFPSPTRVFYAGGPSGTPNLGVHVDDKLNAIPLEDAGIRRIRYLKQMYPLSSAHTLRSCKISKLEDGNEYIDIVIDWIWGNGTPLVSSIVAGYAGDKYVWAGATSAVSSSYPLSYIQDITHSLRFLDDDPPIIQILSPDIQGLDPEVQQDKIWIKGKASDSSGLKAVYVNETEALTTSDGGFMAEIHLNPGRNRIVLKAIDTKGNELEKWLTILRSFPLEAPPKMAAKKAPAVAAEKKVVEKTEEKIENQKPPVIYKKLVVPPFKTGDYYALIIGNNRYRHLPSLVTPRNDAEEISRLLEEEYGFKTTVLLDGTRTEILSGINKLINMASEKDNLLIYYAGHGYFDETIGKAYWMPVDAKKSNDTEWILSDRITSSIKRASCGHLLIVADSCYSGTLTRGLKLYMDSRINRTRFLDKMFRRNSRTLLASGGNEPVLDSGGDGHSIFAQSFIDGLNDMDKTTFTSEELFFEHIKERVAGNAEQVPQYDTIRNSGHDGGDFVFQRINQ
jgi:hypothetical protein